MDGTDDIFDESWCIKDNVEENDIFWENKPTTESISLLKLIVLNHYKIKFNKNNDGYLVVQLPDYNLELNVLSPSGLYSKRGESYVIGDILLFITIKRDDYTYSSITKRGFRYINILERDRLKSILDEPKVNTELLEAKVNYIPINKNEPVIIPGKTIDKQLSSTSNKITFKKLIDDLYNDLNNKYKNFNDNLINDQHIIKKAKHNYLNSLIFITNIHERPIRTRNSLITVHGEGFSRILQKAESATSNKSNTPSSSSSSSKHRETNSIGSFIGTQRKLRVLDEICSKYRKKPIIIVPSGTTSIIARQNIKQLLEDHQFIDPQKSLRENGSIVSTLPMNAIEIVHNISKRPVKFRVIENSYISRFTNMDWISVVCVILSVKGERWQFNGYPFDSFIDLFMTMKGVLFVHDADTVPGEMGSWGIKVLRISRSHRHNDAAIAKEFWQYMESFLLQPRQKKCNMNKKL